MKTTGLALAGLAVGLAASTLPVRADETGLATALHEARREGKRLCLVDHEHFGSSSGQPSKKLAEAAAIRDWAGFTAFEYGTDWANFAKAAGKRMACNQSGSGWGCELSARPCK